MVKKTCLKKVFRLIKIVYSLKLLSKLNNRLCMEGIAQSSIYNLKGQCHEIFDPYFFHLNYSIWVPDRHAKTVFNSFLISQRYSLK